MTDSESPTVNDVFKLLNRWRHLPGYPLEGRSAPFFALFLRDILSAHFGEESGEIHDIVIPEFPLRHGTLCGMYPNRKSGDNQSFNVDYLAFARDMRTAYLVELKTDMGSKNCQQEKYLRMARNTGIPRLIEGARELVEVRRPSNKQRKYGHLLYLLDQLVIDRNISPPKIVFLQPTKGKKDKKKSEKYGFEFIDFGDVADVVQRHGDLGRIFADYLRKWVHEAGGLDPQDVFGQ